MKKTHDTQRPQEAPKVGTGSVAIISAAPPIETDRGMPGGSTTPSLESTGRNTKPASMPDAKPQNKSANVATGSFGFTGMLGSPSIQRHSRLSFGMDVLFQLRGWCRENTTSSTTSPITTP